MSLDLHYTGFEAAVGQNSESITSTWGEIELDYNSNKALNMVVYFLEFFLLF